MDTTSEGYLSVWIVGAPNLFRLGLTAALDQINVQVEAAYDSVEEAARAGRHRTQEPLVITYYASDDVKGIAEDLIALKAHFPEKPIVLIAEGLQPRLLQACSAARINGYLSQSDSPAVLRHWLWLAALGRDVYPPGGTMLNSHQPAENGLRIREGSIFPREISDREREILSHLAAGSPNKEIARHLGITESTVKVHLKNLLRKIGAGNRTQAAMWAVKNGVVALGGSVVTYVGAIPV